MEYCSHCGKEIQENANFCSSCGVNLKSGKRADSENEKTFSERQQLLGVFTSLYVESRYMP